MPKLTIAIDVFSLGCTMAEVHTLLPYTLNVTLNLTHIRSHVFVYYVYYIPHNYDSLDVS